MTNEQIDGLTQQEQYEARKKAREAQKGKKRYYKKTGSMAGGVARFLVIAVIVVGGIYALVKFGHKDAPVEAIPLAGEVTESDWIRGPQDARVTLVEYSDLQCPACKAYEPILQKLLEEFPDDLRLVYRHFPLLSVHPNAEEASWAVEAAGVQGKFWELHDLLFEKQSEWATLADVKSAFDGYARELGLDIDKFTSDYNSKEIRGLVESDRLSGEQARLNSTPSFFLDGERISAPSSFDAFSQLIQSRLDN